MIKLDDIKSNDEVQVLIKTAERQLIELGYTEHGQRHISIVSNLAGKILKEFGYSDEDVELAKIGGYLHDIGNAINRQDHAHTGAQLAYDILRRNGATLR